MAFIWIYDNAVTYQIWDEVSYLGGLYTALQITTWNVPTLTAFWNADEALPDTPANQLQEKTTPAVTWDKVIIIDWEDWNKVKQMDQDQFVWPAGPQWVWWVLQLTTLTDPISESINTVMVDWFDGVVITTTTTWISQIIANPTDTTAWKTFLVINDTNSTNPISINESPLQISEMMSFTWSGIAWTCDPLDLASKSLLGSYIHSWCEVTWIVWGTTFDVWSWIAFIVDNYTDANVPVITRVDFPGQTWISITNIAISPVSYITIDKNGNIWQTTTNTWGEPDRDTPRVWSISHPNLSTADVFWTVTHGVGWDIVPFMSDLANALWILIEKDWDFAFSAASNDMTMARSSGNAFAPWINRLDRKLPNNLKKPAKNPITNFPTTWRDGAGWYKINPINSVVTSWIWDDNSTGTTTWPVGVVNASNYVNHRLFYFPTLDTEVLQYWQVEYNTQQNALQFLPTENFDKNPLLEVAIFRGWLTLKGNATDLSNPNNHAIFTTASKFGAAGSSWSTSAVTNQTVYENSIQPQVITDVTRGAMQYKRWTALDTDTVLEILNGAGITNFSVDGNWKIIWDGSGLTNLSGWKFDFSYPHNRTNFELFSASISNILSFTPPAWKVAYITIADLWTTVWLSVSGVNVGEFWHVNGQWRVSIIRPIILSSSDTAISLSATTWFISWFLVDEDTDITPVFTSWSYTVPSWKYYIISAMYGINTWTIENLFTIDWNTLSGLKTYNINTTDVAIDTSNMPILWPWDTVDLALLNHWWYLIPTSLIS